MTTKRNITIIGTGYVGLSNAILLAQKNKVFALDIDESKVTQINKKKSPIIDKEIEEYLSNVELDLIATTDAEIALSSAEFVIISTPTNYDTEKKCFDTHSVEDSIRLTLSINNKAIIIIKSTIPIGGSLSDFV